MEGKGGTITYKRKEGASWTSSFVCRISSHTQDDLSSNEDSGEDSNPWIHAGDAAAETHKAHKLSYVVGFVVFVQGYLFVAISSLTECSGLFNLCQLTIQTYVI